MRYDETVLCVAGSPVRVYRAGAGPPLVLLHGDGTDCARRSWEPAWVALTARALVLAPDLPGHGGSPLGTTSPTPAGYATWLLAFLDRCGLGSVTLVGRSLGARIAVCTAAAAPDRVVAVVIIGDRPPRATPAAPARPAT